MKKILLYNDSVEFGGHELMSIRMADELSREYEVYFLFYNSKIGEMLGDTVKKINIPFSTKIAKLAFARNNNIFDILALRRVIMPIAPDLSIILQPAIDFCLRGVWASRLLGIKTVSYIPMYTPAKDLGHPFGRLVDLFLDLYCKLFDAFITISAEQKKYIEKATQGRCGVFVLENAVNSIKVPNGGSEVNIFPQRRLRIGLIGRIEFGQKGLERALNIIKVLCKNRKDFTVVVVGGGPDRERFEIMVQERGLADYFVFKGWLENKEEIYSLVDMVLIPSDYEGVPLVMIEALLCKKMVLAHLCSGTQIFADYLQPEYLFSSESEAVDKLRIYEVMLAEFLANAEGVRKTIEARHSPELFKKTLINIVGSLMK